MNHTNIRSKENLNLQSLSMDLSRFVGERNLVTLSLDAVQSLDESLLKQMNVMKPGLRPQMLLTLLTYSYASSLYASKDIESAIETDPTVRYLCAKTRPSWQMLRRFRRQNREAVQQCLLYVLKQVWALKFDQGEADYVGYDWFETQLVKRLERGAQDRIEAAILMDGAESV